MAKNYYRLRHRCVFKIRNNHTTIGMYDKPIDAVRASIKCMFSKPGSVLYMFSSRKTYNHLSLDDRDWANKFFDEFIGVHIGLKIFEGSVVLIGTRDYFPAIEIDTDNRIIGGDIDKFDKYVVEWFLGNV